MVGWKNCVSNMMAASCCLSIVLRVMRSHSQTRLLTGDLGKFVLQHVDVGYLRASCQFVEKANIFNSVLVSGLWQLQQVQHGSSMVGAFTACGGFYI